MKKIGTLFFLAGMALAGWCGPREIQLLDAVTANDILRVRQLIANGADVNFTNDLETAFTIAEKNGFLKICRLLAERGAKFPAVSVQPESIKLPAGKAFKITMQAYSGRENPCWWMHGDKVFRELLDLLNRLCFTDEPLFDYGRFSDLGIVTFRIEPLNIDHLKYSMEIYGDCAFSERQGRRLYARGAQKIFNLLAEISKQKGEKVFE
ncbi:MAG: hypothetical protein PHW04_11090 [Candidatus Wallbacteria bacterium]|nr:hypothetical protein [Candidatus Wallbacteria bacterium]